MKNPQLLLNHLFIAALGCSLSALAQTNPPPRLSETTVYGTNVLAEEMPLGPNGQPEWTARRRFPLTRIYVQPPWQMEAELGWDAAYPRMGKAEHLLQQEFELGLPYRFQFDVENVFLNFSEDDPDRKWRHGGNSIELRYALADWGRIPLNPTLKAEWRFADAAADAYELALQLGTEIAPRWHWGMDLFFEQEVYEDRVREYAVSQALSYTIVDQKFSAGVEMEFKSESDKDTRHDPDNSFLIGPSLQWRPTRRTHFDIAPLVGVTGASPRVECFIFFGVEFGPGSEGERVSPASLRGK